MFLAGIDVAAGGNVFGATKGLAAKHPGRLFDTPISETAIIGLGVGAAMAGLRPVVELMYLDFVGVCLDQIMNQAAKLRFMTGGRAEVGLVIRTQFGVGRSSGSQHSQSLEALLAQVPGLVVGDPGHRRGHVRPAPLSDRPGRPGRRHREPAAVRAQGRRPAAGVAGPIGQAGPPRDGHHPSVIRVPCPVHRA